MVGTSSINVPAIAGATAPPPAFREFKAHFSAFLDRVAAGETIVIAKRNEAIAEIRPIARRRNADVYASPIEAFEVPDSFFEPLPDDLLAAFGEGQAP